MSKDPIFEGKHIFIYEADHIVNAKPTFVVTNKHDLDPLGNIAWFPKWKKYSLYPYPNTIWEYHCLRDVANFLEDATSIEKEKQNA